MKSLIITVLLFLTGVAGVSAQENAKHSLPKSRR